ncbi:MAG TPA: choice-of-anchor Q domain-containing protein, partial [Thermomicrobiales bacterium]|nr:choice-of-anchor Q domain-containing protein [Thermomicrobiales bacterium]
MTDRSTHEVHPRADARGGTHRKRRYRLVVSRPHRIVNVLVVIGLLTAFMVALPVTTRAAAIIRVGVNSCTLADAITAANTDSVTGDCPAGNGSDTIVLESDATYTLTQMMSNDFYLGKSGLPIITTDITIEGNGATIQRQEGAPEFRILTHGGGALKLHDVTMLRGYAPSGDGNSAWGGCLLSADGALEVTDSTFTECYAVTEAGALMSIRSTTLIDGSTFFNNAVGSTVARNGALRTSLNTITITNSTFANNTSQDAITVADWATATLTNLTVVGNHTASVSANWGTSVSYKNSILFSAVYDNGGQLNDLGNNLIGVEPPLLPLGNNGGPTLTMLPAPGAEVIDAASDCPATDQRGIGRPQGSTCDIGAVELVD